MKKKIIFLLFLLTQIGSIQTSANNNWEYLPLSNNYLNPENYLCSGEAYSWEMICLEPFRIKENTVYSLYSRNYSDYFFGEVSLSFYNNSGIEIDYLKKFRTRKYRDYGVMEISFTAPIGAEYLSLDWEFEVMSQPPRNPDELIREFVLYEGENASYFDDYEGPDYLHIPVYEGFSGSIITNINNPISAAMIKNQLKASDYFDGDLTENIEIIEDCYSENMDKIGTYSLVFSIKDSSQNRTDLRININIIDDTPPEILGNNYLITSPEQKLSINEIKSYLSVKDNYDSEVELLLVEDEYSINSHLLGTYRLLFLACDSSGNESSFPLEIEVRDLEKPEISGPSIIRKPYQETLLLSDILGNYSAYDDIDGEVSESLKIILDNYSEKMYKLGSWKLVIEAKDSSGNTETKEVMIEVYDGTGPVFIIEKGLIAIKLSNEEMFLESLILNLQNNNEITNDQVVKIVQDDYSENKKTPGTYLVVLETEEEIFELEIEVEVEESNSKPSFFERIKSFFKRCWQNIKVFFKNLLRDNHPEKPSQFDFSEPDHNRL